MREYNKLEGIKGWLILVAIGIIWGLVDIIIKLFAYFSVFMTDKWRDIITHSSKIYNPALASIIKVEVIITCFLGLIYLYTACLFFTKKKAFPKLYILLAIFFLVYNVADGIALKLATSTSYTPDIIKNIIYSILLVAIWVPYMLKSKRIKVTFVR